MNVPKSELEAKAPGGYDGGGREEKDTALTASSQDWEAEWVVVSDGESWARAPGKHGGGATGGRNLAQWASAAPVL